MGYVGYMGQIGSGATLRLTEGPVLNLLSLNSEALQTGRVPGGCLQGDGRRRGRHLWDKTNSSSPTW